MINLIEDNLAIKRHTRSVGEKRFRGFQEALRQLHRVGPLAYDFGRSNGVETVTVVINTMYRNAYVLRLALNTEGRIFLYSYAGGKEKYEPFTLGIDDGVRVMAAIVADKLAEVGLFTLGVK